MFLKFFRGNFDIKKLVLYFCTQELKKICIFANLNKYYIMSDKREKLTESKALAKLALLGIENKKGLDAVVLDLQGVQSAPANYFVICSGNVPSHVSAICDGIFETVKKATGYNPHRIEGYENAEWILMDYFDVVVHIFLKDKRDHYRLEQLWADGEKTEL